MDLNDVTPDKLIAAWEKEKEVPELWTGPQIEEILEQLHRRVKPGAEVSMESIMAALALEHEIRISSHLQAMLLDGTIAATDTCPDDDTKLSVDNFTFKVIEP